MKTIKIGLFVLIGAMLFNYCQNTTDPYNPDTNDNDVNVSDEIIIDSVVSEPFFDYTEMHDISSEDAVIIALKIKTGEIKETFKAKYRGRDVWIVKIKIKEKGEIKVYVDIKFAVVIKCESDEDDFDYDIVGLLHFIKLSEAIEKALKEKDGYVIKWEIEYHKKHKWFYKIKIKAKSDDKTYFIYIKAKGAVIIIIKEDKEDKECDYEEDKGDTIGLSSNIQITFLRAKCNSDGTSTWYYHVKELEGSQDLSNWVLELPDCIKLISAAPMAFEVVNPDPNTGLTGIKWETGAGFTESEFSITLDKRWEIGEVSVAAKGPGVAFGEIKGPECDK